MSDEPTLKEIVAYWLPDFPDFFDFEEMGDLPDPRIALETLVKQRDEAVAALGERMDRAALHYGEALDALKAENERLTKERDELGERFDRLAMHLTASETMREEVEAENERLRQANENNLAGWADDRAGMERRSLKLQEENERLTKERDAVRKERDGLDRLLDDAEQQASALEARLNKAREVAQDLDLPPASYRGDALNYFRAYVAPAAERLLAITEGSETDAR